MHSDEPGLPTPDNVVRLGLVASTPPPEPPPPPPESGATAPTEGGGGKAREKLIDWGKYGHLLDNFALIYSTDTVYDDSTRLIMKISAMAHAHGADYVRMWKAAEPSACRVERKRWTVMPTDVVFDPTGVHDPDRTVNLFGGLVMEPVKGDVEPMLELMQYLCSRASDNSDECSEIEHWLTCWMAYPLQNVGAKLRSAVIMHGDEGAGKNFLFETLVQIYGEYGGIVGQDELEDKFNDWRSRKLFIVGDEVSSRQELVHNKNRLKALITSPTVQINPKNLPRREEANHINITFLSNELQPQALDNTDRRYLVIFTPGPKDREYYKRLGQWRKEGGTAAWYHYLLHYPLDGWDPYAPAPITEAKLDLIELNRKTPERFWLEWSGLELDLPYRSCSIDQAYRAYGKYCQRVGDRFPVQKTMFSRMLKRISETMRRPATIKPMKPEVGDGVERTTRMFLVTEPKFSEGQTQGQWATECCSEFERELRKYLHGPHSPGDENDGQGGGQ